MSLDFSDLLDYFRPQAALPLTKLKWYRVTKWGGSSDDPAHRDDRTPVTSLDEANIVSSELVDPNGRHMVILDVDVPLVVIPSSTPGHQHVYFPSTSVPWDAYERLLDALDECGILEPGYVGASKARKATALRLPWVRK